MGMASGSSIKLVAIDDEPESLELIEDASPGRASKS
jgi:hypothetical protein